MLTVATRGALATVLLAAIVATGSTPIAVAADAPPPWHTMIEMKSWRDGDTLVVVGRFRNDTGTWRMNAWPLLHFYDQSGDILKTVFGGSWIDPMAPGAIVPFSVSGEVPPGTNRWGIVLGRGDLYEGRPVGAVSIVVGTPWEDAGGRVYPVLLQNRTDIPADELTVAVTLFDADGHVLNTVGGGIGHDRVPPGGEFETHVRFYDHFEGAAQVIGQAVAPVLDKPQIPFFVTWENYFEDLVGFRNDIIWLANEGITVGCSAGRYCPNDPVTRGQMATFLVRALDLPATATDYFTDDETSSHEANINRVRAAGITSGCGPTTYCPDADVSREQMASFLARAFALPTTTTDYFTDDETSSHEANINRVRAAGITSGCTPTTYCPLADVTRGQMAAFLRRALE